MHKAVTIFLFALFPFLVIAQKSELIENNRIVGEFYQKLYNFQFGEAKKNLDRISAKSGGSDAALLETSFYWWTMVSGKDTLTNWDRCYEIIEQSIESIENSLTPPHTNETLFNLVYLYAYKARLNIQKKQYIKALDGLAGTMKYLKPGLERYQEFEKFKLTSGLYNYFAALSLEEFPIFYPFFIFVPKGDKKLGHELLTECAQHKNIILNTEARYFLMRIRFQEEKNYPEAIKIARSLIEDHPGNLLFRYYLCAIYKKSGRSDLFIKELEELKRTALDNSHLNSEQKNHFIKILTQKQL